MLTIVNVQVGWFVCILGAAWGYPWVGPLFVAAAAGWHLTRARHRRNEAALLALAGLFGIAADAVLMLAGWMVFPPEAVLGWPVPLWMIALWVNFATLLNGPLRRLEPWPWLAAALGAPAGALAYWGGERFGAVSLAPEVGLWAVAAEWAVATPVLGWLARRTRGTEP